VSNQMYLSPASASLQNFNFSDYFVYVIGGQHEGKMMSQNRILELLKLNRYRVVLIGGPEDAEKGDFLAKHSDNQLVESLAGKLNLSDSMHLLAKAKFVISHDTGLMHVAAGFQKNIISLWGTTSPSLGFAPYKPGKHSVILESTHLLRPTSKLGKKRFFPWINYVDHIPLSDILEQIERLWKIKD
ncbi:MAG: glycosyltransferase family 9 protein, partial [Flavobacteriales bacterium]